MARKSEARFAIGVDYGTNSVRALVVDLADGNEIATHVYNYPSGEAGVLLDKKDPNLARQSPADYIDGFFTSVRRAVAAAKRKRGFKPENVVGIGVDTTGSTPIPVDQDGTPLALQSKFKKKLAAQAWLWKDHTGHAEAAEITAKAANDPNRYLANCGGTYSSEWYWSKIWHCKREDPDVFAAAYSWVELADFVPGLHHRQHRIPHTMKRGICAAGHKAMYSEKWGGLPSAEFLASLDPDLPKVRENYSSEVVPADRVAGHLTAAVAKKVGLPAGRAVAVGAFDAHMGAVGAGIQPGTLVKIIGTSTCDMMVAPIDGQLPEIPGLCGIVPGSIMPGMYGLEAGQSAVGDIFNWFANQLAPAKYAAKGDAHDKLTRDAEKLQPAKADCSRSIGTTATARSSSTRCSPACSSGRRCTPTAPEVYRALVEATAFGALTIINRFEEYGVKVEEVVNCGGIAEKNPFVMQIYADVCNRPMKISRSAQTCALGAAIFGAVAGGAYRQCASTRRRR